MDRLYKNLTQTIDRYINSYGKYLKVKFESDKIDKLKELHDKIITKYKDNIKNNSYDILLIFNPSNNFDNKLEKNKIVIMVVDSSYDFNKLFKQTSATNIDAITIKSEQYYLIVLSK
jgi:hypothetical protein